ncbi:hypothetical protein Celaphus_00017540, partial [Cervus elaphus hippelaphus]
MPGHEGLRAVLVRLEGCSHPVVMKGLCAECGQDLTQKKFWYEGPSLGSHLVSRRSSDEHF